MLIITLTIDLELELTLFTAGEGWREGGLKAFFQKLGLFLKSELYSNKPPKSTSEAWFAGQCLGLAINAVSKCWPGQCL